MPSEEIPGTVFKADDHTYKIMPDSNPEPERLPFFIAWKDIHFTVRQPLRGKLDELEWQFSVGTRVALIYNTPKALKVLSLRQLEPGEDPRGIKRKR